MTIVASAPESTVELTPAQAAAAAKVAFAVEAPGAVAVLCGPAGVGKTTVLESLAHAAGAACRSIQVTSLAALAGAAGGGASAACDDRLSRSGSSHPILLVDDAHETDVTGLAALMAGYRRLQPATAVVLAGEGRLLTLVAGDTRLEQSIRLRATLPVFSLADTRRLLAGRLGAVAGAPGEAVLRTIHEIAGGVPAASLRLAEVADMVAAVTPRPLVPDDIEIIHRRLSLSAA